MVHRCGSLLNRHPKSKKRYRLGCVRTVRLHQRATACRGGREQDTCALRLPAHSFFASKK